jgi:hypothetical protein
MVNCHAGQTADLTLESYISGDKIYGRAQWSEMIFVFGL